MLNAAQSNHPLRVIESLHLPSKQSAPPISSCFDLVLLRMRKTVLVAAVRRLPLSSPMKRPVLLEFITCSEEILLTVSGATFGPDTHKTALVSFLLDSS